MDILKEEKLNAINEVSVGVAGSGREKLSDKVIPITTNNTAEEKVVDFIGGKTREKTKKEYKEVFSAFKKTEAKDFEKHMGYGLKTIKKIGYQEFIDFMDWKTPEDVVKWRTDKIKVLPCCNCKSHFTTYQIDLGLCAKCAGEFEIKKFEQAMNTEEELHDGGGAGLLVAFVFLDDFRNFYKKKPLKEKIESLADMNYPQSVTFNFLVEDIVGDADKEKSFIDINSFIVTALNDVMLNEKFKTVNLILQSEDSKDDKISRLRKVFGVAETKEVEV